MIQVGKKQFGISGFTIRITAVIFMILSGIGMIKGRGYEWMQSFSWTAFSLYAFLLAEGVAHSSSKIRYFLRILLFAIVSEFAYDYFRFGKLISWKYSSAMFTILIGFVVICLLTLIKKRFENIVLNLICIAVLGYIATIPVNMFSSQFGSFGIIIIVMFYVARNVTYSKITQLVVIIYICFYLSSEVLVHITVGSLQYPLAPQLFCLAALPIIWLYNDTRGPNSLIVQILQYAAYPIVLGVFILYKYFL